MRRSRCSSHFPRRRPYRLTTIRVIGLAQYCNAYPVCFLELQGAANSRTVDLVIYIFCVNEDLNRVCLFLISSPLDAAGLPLYAMSCNARSPLLCSPCLLGYRRNSSATPLGPSVKGGEVKDYWDIATSGDTPVATGASVTSFCEIADFVNVCNVRI